MAFLNTVLLIEIYIFGKDKKLITNYYVKKALNSKKKSHFKCHI